LEDAAELGRGGAGDEATAGREPAGGGQAVGLDAAAELQVGGAALRALRWRRAPGPQVRRRAGHEVEGRAGREHGGITEVAVLDRRAVGGAVPGKRAPRELDAHRLRLDADRARPWQAPREQHEHRADAAAQVEQRGRRRGERLLGRAPGGDQVVERPALTVEALEDAPVASQVAEVLARTRPEATVLRRSAGRRARRAPADGPARAADDAR